MTNKEQIKFWQKAIRILKNGYGANCPKSDLDERFWKNEKMKLSEIVLHSGRCFNCRAKETIAFIQEIIKTLKLGYLFWLKK
jgi:hypothetical protein